MRPRNRPKFNAGSGLTPDGGGPAGERSGSAPKGIETGPSGVSRRALREFFAPGTAAAGGLAAAVGELAATLSRPIHNVGVVATEVAAAAPAAGGHTPGTAAAGPDVEPDAQPAERGRRRVGRQVDIRADVVRANPFTPPPDGTAGRWR